MIMLLSPVCAQQIGEGFEYSKYIHANEIKVTSISLQILLKCTLFYSNKVQPRFVADSSAIKIDDEPHEPNEMMDPSLYEFVKLDSVVPFKSCVRKRSAKELQTPAGNSLLHVAVSYGSDNITSYLAETFPSLITIQNSQKDTILHLAAREGKASDTIKSLAESNPSLMRKTNTKGNTPLHDAVIKGNKELAKLLVSRDPEVAYYNNKNGRSPLHLAVENGNKNGILDDLLKTKASFPIRSEDDMLEKIEKAKPDLLCLTDKELGNSLHHASSTGFLEGVQFLLQKFLNGAYKRNHEGNYPIHLACKNDSVDVVKEFLKITPFPKEFLNKKGQNILHVAAENGNGNVVRYILRQEKTLVEPLLNEMDEDGNTPLHLATNHGHSVAAFVLVRDKRVDSSIVNNENVTPYDIAEKQSKIAVEQYEKTDEMLAEYRKQFDSKNSTPADKNQRFTSTQGKPPRKQETKSRIENLLVVAVLVAGLTFAGAIQMPQLRDKNNKSEHLHELNSTATASRNSTALDSPTGSSLLDALGGSNYGVFAIIIIVVGIAFFVAQTLLYIQWILPPSVNQIMEGLVSHYVYYISFFVLVYSWRWLTDKLPDLCRKKELVTIQVDLHQEKCCFNHSQDWSPYVLLCPGFHSKWVKYLSNQNAALTIGKTALLFLLCPGFPNEWVNVGYEAINIDENSIPRDHMANAMIDSQLHECVRQNINTEEFRRLVQQRSAEKLVTPCGNTLLHVAVSCGSDNITSYLAPTFPSLITIQNSQKDTILHLAAREGKASDTIKSLAESNPSLMRKTNTKGNTPLHDAVITDNKEVAKLLVSRDPEVAYYNNNNGKSPLYLAVEKGKKNGILDDLLNLGASFAIRSEDGDALPEGKSPVHAAIKQRNRDILEKIGKEKPELLRLTEEEFGNSLHYASSIGFLEGVRFLLTKFHDGAYETNLEGNYPIHVACKSHSVDVVKEFLDIFPYPKEFLNKKGKNILHVAAKYGNSSVVRYILEQDQKLVAPLLNAIDEDGNTPLHLAAGYGRCTATFLLVRDNRVEHFIVNNRNWTPYELAEDFSKRVEETYIKTDEMVMTLSILFVNARPKKSLKEIFPATGLPMSKLRKEATTRIGNLLVVAVLVAVVTFAGHLRESSVWLFVSRCGGFIFLSAGSSTPSFAKRYVSQISNRYSLVFSYHALGGSNYGVFAIIIIVVGIAFFVAQTLLYIQWILPPSVNQIMEGLVSHYVYSISFFVLVYNMLEKIEKAKPDLLCLTDKELGNSLHYASSRGFQEGVQFLLQKFLNGAYKRNHEGNYPIHLACKNDSVDVVKEFLKITPFPKEFLNKKGQNILHAAAENGNGNVVRYILRQEKTLVEPLLNEMDEDGNTPLHLATNHGHSVAAFVLVRDKRVDSSIVNNENLTPYDIAEKQSKIAVEQYEKTDEMLAEYRKQFDSKNSTPADKNQDNAVDSKEHDTKKSPPKDFKLLDYYGAINIDENSIPRDHLENAMIDSQLHECVKQDNPEALKRRFQQHLTEKLATPCGNTLLHVAVSYGSDNIIVYLVKEFPSLITMRNSQNDTVLHLAARERTAIRTIKSLVELNPSLMRMENGKRNTPLHDAVIKCNEEVAKFLVSRDPEVAYYSNKNGRSPLYLSVENGNKNGILDDLLDLGASIPITREDGDALPKRKSPVHAAIEQRNIDLLEKIAKAKPELLCLTAEELGNSLHYASSICFLEGVQFLLKKFLNGAYETNSDGNYPIHVACKNDSVDVVKEFLKITPFPKEFLNKKGQNILHVAAENGQGNVVRYILENDQKIVEPLLNEMDEDGNTPLHLAARHGQSTAAFVLVRDKRVENLIVNNENFTPYDVAKQQSKMAVDQYNKTDEMLAKDREQFDSKNSIHADEIQIEVNSEDVKDGKKNYTTEKATASTGSQGKDKAVDSKDYKLIDYYGTMTTLSILYFHARPNKSLYERFTSTQGKPPRKQETKSRIENLLVVAVLVAGVTFAGAIQMPQLRDKNNSSTTAASRNSTAFDSPTGSSLLDGYLCLDVWALNTSVVAAIILLWTNLNDVKFAPFAVWFSSLMVGGSIYMMCLSFFFAVSIALGGSNYGVFAIILIVVGIVFFVAQTLLYIQWILPPSVNQIIEGKLSHYVYYISFFMLVYNWRCLTSYSLPRRLPRLHKLRDLWTKPNRNDQQDTILHVAAKEGSGSHTIRNLVNSNAFLLRMTNRKGNSPLHVAVINGKKEFAEFLISRDPEVAYYRNETGRSPLYLAVENRNMNILDDLLNTEASIPTEREDGDSLGMLPQGKSPVHAAVENRIIGILQKIEEAKPELLRLHEKELGNPLHYASSTGYVEGVQFLLQKYRAGADETDQEGNYPIHLACKGGSVALLKEFLKVIPYPEEFINKKEQNILHVAAQNGHGSLIMYILEQDQKIVETLLNAMDEDGNTPLHLATQHGRPTSVFLLVRDKRVYRHPANNDDLTPYGLGRKQSKIAVERYEGTDETFAKERQHSDSNNRVEGTEDKPADQNKQDTKKASLKDNELPDFRGAMMTLSILYFHAFPWKKSFRDHFTGARPMQPRRKETKTRIGNLLVVAVLVAGVTFAGAIQLPQLRGNFNSSEHHHEFHSSTITASHYKITAGLFSPPGYETLLHDYLSWDVWALSLSLVASLILLRANFTDASYEFIAVGFSVIMVGLAILMMFAAFIDAVNIALLGSHDALSNTTFIVAAAMGLYALVFIVIVPSGVIQPNLREMLLHCFYYDDLRQQRSGFVGINFPPLKGSGINKTLDRFMHLLDSFCCKNIKNTNYAL
ncbi:hypothetical protein NC652_031817 [Populus alba x Populus x berolinensis]|nr:hypothetical protein NC652_031817 [Populus alba x Populus x berolinensis]